MIFEQYFESQSSSYTYLLACEHSQQALLIDPVQSEVEHYVARLSALGLSLVYSLETHVHADHITGASLLRDQLGAKTVLHRASNVACGDLLLSDGCIIRMGSLEIETRYTPGHTNACMSYVCGNAVFTGDTLLINGCGRTDFQGGDAGRLYDSIQQQLFSLPDETVVYPAHDYHGKRASTIGHEREHNARLGQQQSRDAFIALMGNLKLAYPAKIAEALPANQACGATAKQNMQG
ncbi:MBL fold metallo-hydrolase [Acinetobacter sp. MD2]|uniref:MBL fold metallo-hydrolase n=1 Tax=Acinetobacter sp. MD2 TaxID=2600066 RepID=UPI002D1F2D1B|nr:MBL fold metallo-hydrolase [Acinetobacter sp. MD2]MEB3766571.1 MBL fold metallo-hydrolase [Acinetobacter sp. MD2]